MSDASTLTAGIDTAKDKLDMAVHGHAMQLTVENQAAGWKRLAAALRRAHVGRVGIEATGGYERGVVAHLRSAGLVLMVLQPLQTKAYARLHMRRAKNDAIDAALIAACTAALDPPRLEPDARLDALADQLTFVEQTEEDAARLKTRLEHIQDKRLRRIVTRQIARLAALRAAELLRIVRALQRHPDLAGRLELVLSVPGSASAPPSRSCCVCPSSAVSAARLPRRSPGWHRSTTTAVGTRDSATSPAGGRGCVARSTPPHCPRHAAGTRR